MIDSRRILLADDNDANRLITRTILERSGFAVTSAKNGSQALSLAKLEAFDLVILDIMMPVMDGMKALRRLRRQDGPNQKTPAFALTAYCSAQDRQRYLLSGFDYVLSKPLRPGDIELAIKSHMRKTILPTVNQVDVKSSEDLPLLDDDIISQLLELGEPQRLTTIQTRYWTSIEEQCGVIKTSLPEVLRGSSDHLSQLRRAIHTVKGASAAIGLARVAHISRRLQNSPPSDIPGLMLIFADTLSKSRPALTEALSRPRQLDTAMQMRREDQSKAAHNS